MSLEDDSYLIIARQGDHLKLSIVPARPVEIIVDGLVYQEYTQEYMGDYDVLLDLQGRIAGFSYLLAEDCPLWDTTFCTTASVSRDDLELRLLLVPDLAATDWKHECSQVIGSGLYLQPDRPEAALVIPLWHTQPLNPGIAARRARYDSLTETVVI